MSKHTPGPWRVHGPDDIRRIDPSDFDPEDWHGYAWVGAGGHPDGRFQSKVADLDRTDDASKEWRERALADARLIARSPDMYSLLERIYTDADEQDEGKGGRFSVELMEELRRFVKEMQK